LVALNIQRNNRFKAAADKFRSSLLNDMKGLIPNGHRSEKKYPRFEKSVPSIKKAALEFKPHVQWHRKGKFDAAIVDFCTFCEQTTWMQDAADVIYNTMIEGPTQKQEGLRKFYVLLSFTVVNT